jgi:hypothetical protein
MPDPAFDPARIGIQLDRAEESGAIETDVVEQLRALVRAEEDRRLDEFRYLATIVAIPLAERHSMMYGKRPLRRPAAEISREVERGLGETHEAHGRRIQRLVREGRIGPR